MKAEYYSCIIIEVFKLCFILPVGWFLFIKPFWYTGWQILGVAGIFYFLFFLRNAFGSILLAQAEYVEFEARRLSELIHQTRELNKKNLRMK